MNLSTFLFRVTETVIGHHYKVWYTSLLLLTNQLLLWTKIWFYNINLQGLHDTTNWIAIDVHRKKHHIQICQWSELTNNISINQQKDYLEIIKILTWSRQHLLTIFNMIKIFVGPLSWSGHISFFFFFLAATFQFSLVNFQCLCSVS